MKLLIVRHGDPNYKIDGLTEKGRREAELLADRLVRENPDKIYCSTLGRARLTAEPTLKRLNTEAEYCEWLREFGYAKVKFPYQDEEDGCWDVLPAYVNTLPEIYSPTEWKNTEFIKDTEVPAAYDRVVSELDNLLLRHGYRREGYNYIAERPNHDTVVLVCHFGVSAVLLSHLMNCSPYSIWQHGVTLTTSVTTFYTEEREKGVALFRCSGFSDVSHLYIAGEEPSFSARFCECFTDDTRHH